MNIDLGSFAFGSYLEDGVGTPSWGTSLGQGRPQYYITREGAEELIMGMIYKSVPLTDVSLPLGRGARMFTCSEAGTIQLASVFNKVYVNGTIIPYPFIIVLQKEDSPSHSGRRGVKYTDKAIYEIGGVRYTNAEFVKNVRDKFGLSEDSCWFVYDISVLNHEELHMKAVFVNKDSNEEYRNSKQRGEEWIKLIDEEGESYNASYTTKTQSDTLPLQQIFYGAPGTGKSDGIKRQEKDFSEVVRTTFHPDSDYATFVGAYKPIMKKVRKCVVIGKEESEIKASVTKDDYEEKISYSFVKQAFLKAYISAWKGLNEQKNVLLVIEEINRGNCAQIFGDLFQLLDRETEGENRGYSTYPIVTDEDLREVLAEDFKDIEGIPENVKSGENLLLPPNLYIWATMNTSDQSLFPIDSAFKRRWDWVYKPIKYDNKDWKVVLKDGSWCKWTDLQQTLNELIYDATESEDKMLGDWFVKAEKDEISEEVLVGKIIFYLWNDVAKVDAGKLFDLEVEKRGGKRKVIFSDFYNVDGTINSEIVKNWLKSIGIECVES